MFISVSYTHLIMDLEELKNCKYGFTHSGIFHADDVFATAFIKMINPNIEIVRGNDCLLYTSRCV